MAGLQGRAASAGDVIYDTMLVVTMLGSLISPPSTPAPYLSTGNSQKGTKTAGKQEQQGSAASVDGVGALLVCCTAVIHVKVPRARDRSIHCQPADLAELQVLIHQAYDSADGCAQRANCLI
jgi:hypothetical protein